MLDAIMLGDLHTVSLLRPQYIRTSVATDIHTDSIRLPRPPLTGWKKWLEKAPLGRTIVLAQPSPPPPDALDIRENIPIIPARSHSDIFVPPIAPWRRMLRTATNRIERSATTILRWTFVVVLIGYIAIIAFVGLRSSIQDETVRLYGELASLRSAVDVPTAEAHMQEISSRFDHVAQLFSPIGLLADNTLISSSRVRTAGGVIRGGHDITIALILASGMYDRLHALIYPGHPETPFNVNDIETHHISITGWLRGERPTLDRIHATLGHALTEYARVSSLGDPILDEKFQKNVTELTDVYSGLGFTLDHFDVIIDDLGDTHPIRYVVMNQNQDELHAGGGFPGTIIMAELYQGRIQQYSQRDVYDYDWKLYPYAETPPPGVDRITDHYGLRDANYYPLWKDTLSKVNFFYEKGGGGTIDTLIGINQSIVIDLLRQYGGVAVPSIGRTIDADNFSLVMSTLVESKIVGYHQTGTDTFTSPKDILFDFIGALVKHLKEKGDYPGYIRTILDHLTGGDILVVSRDQTTQSLLDSLGWREPWRADHGNWSMPLFTSLSGNKSDRSMDRTFTMESVASGSCRYVDTFTLDSRHTFGLENVIAVKKLLYDFAVPSEKYDEMVRIQGNGPNIQYVRLLAPPNATLLDPMRHDVTTLMGDSYTAFAFTVQTDPLSTSSVSFRYAVKPEDCSGGAKVYKQP